MRILVTGSRDWFDDLYITGILDNYTDTPVTLVSGGCPTGADYICENYAAWRGWQIEEHPAEWDKYGKKAGPIRNAKMVALGADVCLAFIKNRSRGATTTAWMAQEAGIPTQVWRQEEF